MIRNLSLYFKYQTGYLLLLVLLFALPLALFFQYSPYSLPMVQYIVLGCLIVFQYFFYNEHLFRTREESRVIKTLQIELKRTPSKREINKRLNFLVTCRGGSIILAGLSIFCVMVYFNKY